MMFSNRALFRHEQGASSVEMALILPILFLLLFGIIDMGRFYWAQHSVVHAANEAARLAVLKSATQDEIDRVIAFHLRDWDKNSASKINYNAPNAGTPASVTVSVSLPFKFLVIPNLVTGAFEPQRISHSVTMQLEW